MINLTWATKRLLMAEICNEDEGGVTPATLKSALCSVKQGYDPDPEEEFDMNKVKTQLTELIDEFGTKALAQDFIIKADWDRRFEIADRKERQKNSLAVPSEAEECA
jgi:type II secretory pathway component GspD/PulD (secretin)